MKYLAVIFCLLGASAEAQTNRSSSPLIQHTQAVQPEVNPSPDARPAVISSTAKPEAQPRGAGFEIPLIIHTQVLYYEGPNPLPKITPAEIPKSISSNKDEPQPLIKHTVADKEDTVNPRKN